MPRPRSSRRKLGLRRARGHAAGKKGSNCPIVGIGGSAGGFEATMELLRHLPTQRVGPKSELEKAIQRYVDLFDFAPIGYVSFDRAGRIEEINLTAVQLLGSSRQRLIGAPFAICVARSDTQLFLNHLFRCHSSETRAETELHLKRSDGTLLHVLLSSAPGHASMKDGALLYHTAIVDLTERKRTEERLTEQARLLDLSNDAILVRDAQDRITYWNHGATEIYGYSAEEALGKVTPKLLRTEHPQPLAQIRKQLERDGRWSGELVHTCKDGTKIVMMSRWSLDRDAKGKPASVLETNTDITARKKAEAALERSRKLLETLVHQRTKALRSANAELEAEIRRRKGLEGEILAISDREQQRFGQELHDGLCQQLTAISFMAHAIALRLKNHRVIDAGDIEKIAQLISRSVASTRSIARDLHKEKVDAATFETALRDLVNREVWKTPCRLALKTETNIQDDKVAADLYRILREALVNANKHARATEIALEVRRERGELVCSVSDNGVGVNSKMKDGRGLGFQIMNYRAQSIGARLEMKSRRNRGTSLAVYLPQPENR